jgi:AAA+ ATPase superfamily predicted ATPase
MSSFPLGLAEGSAFCNRAQERKKLKNNIHNNTNTVIVSPRRFGKSSLILYVLNEMKIPYGRVDLFVTLDEATVAREIIDGVNNVLNLVAGKPEKIISSMKEILKNVSTKWSVGTDGVSIELSRKEKKDSALAVRDSLIILDEILKKKSKKAVFFIDEFQEIAIVAEAKGIEGAIRSVAEKSKNLVFIFSGSNRHALSSMFDDRSRPLYMLCDKITLNRIAKEDYINFINKAAIKKWGKSLSNSFFDKLFEFTAMHTYYVNLICGRLFSEHNAVPNATNVEHCWWGYVTEEKTRTSIELSKLSLIQKKVLILIANGQVNNLTSKDILQKISTTSASVIKALKSLVAKDYIYEIEEVNYKIVDPLIQSSICKFFPQNELI